jgi:Protein of unknown function (DUF938)
VTRTDSGDKDARYAAGRPGRLGRRPTYESLETQANVRQPLYLDVIDAQWPIEAADAIICINMIHIAPWAATQGLLRGSSRILPPAGLLCLYGPYRVRDKHWSASNRAFDAQLRAINAEWGIRDLDAVLN